jgi:hypothetical protein
MILTKRNTGAYGLALWRLNGFGQMEFLSINLVTSLIPFAILPSAVISGPHTIEVLLVESS